MPDLRRNKRFGAVLLEPRQTHEQMQRMPQALRQDVAQASPRPSAGTQKALQRQVPSEEKECV